MIVRDKKIKSLIIVALFISLAIYYKFIIFQEAFIFTDVGADTINSYWPYYKYIIEAIKNGKLTTWGFNLGIGTSTLTLAQLIFDPFNIFMFLVPLKYIQYTFVFIMIFKILISVMFSYLYFKKLKINDESAFITALIWGFNGYMILWGQHYMFATVIVYFTILMYTTELFIQNNIKQYFYLSIFIFAINSPYLLYATTIYMGLYAIIRYIYIYNNIRLITQKTVIFIGNYIIGILLSSVIFIPICYLIISSPRVESSMMINPISFRPMFNIITDFTRIFSNNLVGVGNNYLGAKNYYESMMLSGSCLSLILIPQLFFMNKDNGKNKKIILIVTLIGIISILFQGISFIFNGFNNVEQTRWSFVLLFTINIGIAFSLNNIIEYRYMNKKVLIISAVLSLIICFAGSIYIIMKTVVDLSKTAVSIILTTNILIFLLVVTYSILLLFWGKIKDKSNIKFMIVILVFELIANNYATINMRPTIDSNFINLNQGYYDSTIEAVDYIEDKDDSFYRIDKNYTSVFLNDSVYQEYFGLSSYNSLNTPSWVEFLRTFNEIEGHINYLKPMNNNKRMLSFLGIKYILSKDMLENDNLEYMEKINDIYIYINKDAFPLGLTYDSYIKLDDFDKLSKYEKEDIILNNVILEDDSNIISERDKYEYKNLVPNIVGYSNVDILEKTSNSITYEVAKDDPKIIFELENKENFDVIIKFKLKTNKSSVGELFYSKDGVFEQQKSIQFELNPEKEIYEITVDNPKKVRLDIGNIGDKIYISDIEISKREDLRKSLELKDKFKITKFKDSNIIGNINVDKNKILVWSIPYCRGWSVKVDGKQAETFKSNVGFLGINIYEGYHDIELKYIPPGFKLGLIITLSTILILISIKFIKQVRLENKK